MLLKANAKRYYTGYFPELIKFNPDISTNIIADHGSVIFSALNFALFTQPKRIYLVGCDVSNNGYFDDPQRKPTFSLATLLNGWHEIKELQQIHFPSTEIISINPVGLKGLFKDMHM